jgi:hypothetical protein
MTEQFIYNYIPGRIKQLEYNNYYLQFKDLVLDPAIREVFFDFDLGQSNDTNAPFVKEIISNNTLYFIIDVPDGVIVESDYGQYNTEANDIDQTYEHRGTILIRNYDNDFKRIKFIVCVLVN